MVVQESHSGPLLFWRFINDLPDRIQYFTFELFADDTCLRKNITSPIDNIFLQCDINNLYQWLIDGLSFNIKCHRLLVLQKERN